MSDVSVTFHRLGAVHDALSGKEADGAVVTFGDYKQTPLSWKSLRALLAMKFPSQPAKPVPAVPVGDGKK